MGQAGGVLLTETIRTSGRSGPGAVGGAGAVAEADWRCTTRPRSCCDLALTLAFGGDCLADIAVLRAEPGVFGRVASDPTVSRTIDALAADATAALAAIDTARAAARATGVGAGR